MRRLVFISIIFFLSSCKKELEILPFVKGNKVGIVSSSGEILIPPIFQQVEIPKKSLGISHIKVSDSLGNWGFIDKYGDFVIDTKFRFVNDFSEGIAFVCENNEPLKAINPKGETLFILEGISAVSKFNEGLAAFQKSRRYGFLNSKGDIEIIPQFLMAGDFSSGLASVQCYDCPDYPDSFGKWGFIDKSGGFIIKPKYSRVFDFTTEGTIASLDGDYYLINKIGTELLLEGVEEVHPFFGGLARFKKNGKYGFINSSGKESIPPIFKFAKDFRGKYAVVSVDGNEWGIIDLTGKMVVSPTFDKISSVYGESFFFEKGNALGLRKVSSTNVLFSDFDGFKPDESYDLIIYSCLREYEAILEDIFSEKNFPFIPILAKDGVRKIENIWGFNLEDLVPYENAKFLTESKNLNANAIQKSGAVLFESSNYQVSTRVFVEYKIPALSQEDVNEFLSLLKVRFKKLDSNASYLEDFDQNSFGGSAQWFLEKTKISVSYEWNIFDGPDDALNVQIFIDNESN